MASVGRHGRLAVTYQVDSTLRNMDVLGHAVAGNLHRLNKVLEQHVAGMHWSEPLASRDIREVDLPEFVTSNRRVLSFSDSP